VNSFLPVAQGVSELMGMISGAKTPSVEIEASDRLRPGDTGRP